MKKLVGGRWYIDTDVPDGSMVLESPRGLQKISMSASTMRYVFWETELRSRLADLIEDWVDGTYELPQQFRDFVGIPEEAVDLLAGLKIAPRWVPSDHCAHGPCILPADRTRSGFRLCVFHDSLLDGLEHLVA